MDRMADSGSVGWAFESPRDHKGKTALLQARGEQLPRDHKAGRQARQGVACQHYRVLSGYPGLKISLRDESLVR